MHKRISTHEKILYVTVVVLIAATLFQAYSVYQLKNELAVANLELKSQNIIMNSLQQELVLVQERTTSQFSTISSQIKESSSKISNIQKDISNIQVKSQDFSGIVEEVIKSVVAVVTDISQGSGVFIKREGYIITNYHVIENARKVRVLTYDNKLHDAKIIGISRGRDIALLQIESDEYSPLKLGDSDEVKIGQRVIAVGNPLGLSFSVTEGIVSAVDRVGPNGLKAYIQTDVPINPGNSGGPLINIKKEIIGITNFKIGGFESLGFAIDSNHVQEVIEEIFKKLEEQNQ
ncbi:MAG: trypsin-like peptidase domain-containing protein [Nanoarchaeota archaeon]